MTLRERSGTAIIAALGGIVVIGALIAGVFFASAQERKISGGSITQERAFRAAELGLNTTLAKWDNSAMYSMPVGGMDTLTYSGADWVDTVLITKLTPWSFSMLSSATAGGGQFARSWKRTLLNVRLSIPRFDVRGALTAAGTTDIRGASSIVGNDTHPGWNDCPATGAGKPALAMADTAVLKHTTCTNLSCLHGTPKLVQEIAAADSNTYFDFGDEDWESLVASATKVIPVNSTLSQIRPVVTSGGECDKGQLQNWGAPRHTVPANPCQSYFPIIYAPGSTAVLRLAGGGAGQGILLVESDLEISGGFEFYGIVITRGHFKALGTGGKVNGAIMVASSGGEAVFLSGNSTLTYSKCAVDKAILGSANPRRMAHRAWMEVH